MTVSFYTIAPDDDRIVSHDASRLKQLLTLERANGQIKSTGTWWVLISKCKGLLEETELRKADLTVRVNLG